MENQDSAAVQAAIRPETAEQKSVTVGGKVVTIMPLKRRWQHLFGQAALPMFRAELSATEVIQKAIGDGTIDFINLSAEIINGELESDKVLDRAAAVILASKIPGAEKTVEATVEEQAEWLRDNATSQEMRALVEAQADQERLIQTVGERLPARFARSQNLAGNLSVTEDSVKQLLTNYFAKSLGQTGSGS